MMQEKTTFITGHSSDYYTDDNLLSFHLCFDYDKKFSEKDYQQISKKIRRFQKLSKRWLVPPYKLSQDYQDNNEEQYSCTVPSNSFDADDKIIYLIGINKNKTNPHIFTIFNMKINGIEDFKKSKKTLKAIHKYCFGIDISNDRWIKERFFANFKEIMKEEYRRNFNTELTVQSLFEKTKKQDLEQKLIVHSMLRKVYASLDKE